MKYQIKRIDIINRWKYRGCGHFVLIGWRHSTSARIALSGLHIFSELSWL